MGMKEWLSHKMEIEEFDLTTKTVGQEIVFLQRERTLWSLCLGTEQTIEITYIGYFKVTACYHYI
jgi:hypothetical protein